MNQRMFSAWDDEVDDDEWEEDEDHEPWCDDVCDGTMKVDGGFATVACTCSCHAEATTMSSLTVD